MDKTGLGLGLQNNSTTSVSRSWLETIMIYGETSRLVLLGHRGHINHLIDQTTVRRPEGPEGVYVVYYRSVKS